MDKDLWIATLDRKSAYWHVPIHPKFQNLSGLRVGPQAYKFRVLPFGVNIVSHIFAKLCPVVMKGLRLKGIKIFAYLDDWIVWAPPFMCCQAVNIVYQTIQKYMFLINAKNSSLVLTQKIQWLDLVCNTKAQSLSLPDVFQKKVQTSL